MDTNLQWVQDYQDRCDDDDGDGDCATMIMMMMMVIVIVHDDGDDAKIENMHGSLFSTPASTFVRAALLKSEAGNEVWEMKTRLSVRLKKQTLPREKIRKKLFGIVDPRH